MFINFYQNKLLLYIYIQGFGPCSSVSGPVGNDSERCRTVPGSQVYIKLIVLRVLRLYYIDCVSSYWPTDNAAMWPWLYFQRFAGSKLKAKTIVPHFRSTYCQRREDVRIIYGMWLWLISLSTCSLVIWSRRRPHVTGMFLLFAGVMRGSWRQHILSPRLSYYITNTLIGQVSQYSFQEEQKNTQDLQYRFQDWF